MCGITGLFDTRGKRPVDDVILRRILPVQGRSRLFLNGRAIESPTLTHALRVAVAT